MAFKMGTGYIDLVARDRVLQAQLGALKGKMMGAMGPLGALTTGFGLLGMATVVVGAVAVKSFAKFEQQMANVSTMLDEQNMKYMPEYSRKIKQMAKDTGQSTEAITGGMYDILSASVDASKALDVLDISLKAAVAGMTDTKTAADGLTTVLNSYGLAAEDAGKVSDIMFQIVKRGKTTFPELASNIGKVASLAAITGMSLEELGAGLATLTRGGLQTQIATRGIRALLNTIIKGGGPEAAKVTRELGMSMDVATLQSIGLRGMLEKLKDASIEQLSALMPNVQGLSAFATALQQVEGFGADYEALLNSSGSTMIAYAKMTSTLTFKFKRLWQTIKMGFVTIGAVLAPLASLLGDVLLKAVNKIGSAFKFLKNEVQPLGAVFRAAFVPLIEVLSPVSEFIGIVMVKSVTALKLAFTGIVTALEFVKFAFQGAFDDTVLGEAVHKIGTVLFNALKDVGLAFQFLSFLVKNWRLTLKVAFFNSAALVVGFGADIKHVFTKVIPATLNWFLDNWKEIFQTLWSGTKAVFINMGKNIGDFFKALWSWMKGDGWDFEWTGLLSGFENTVGKFPEIADREMGKVEKAMLDKAKDANAAMQKAFDEEFGVKRTLNIMEEESEKLGEEKDGRGKPTISKGAAKTSKDAGAGAGGESPMTGLIAMWDKLAGASLKQGDMVIKKETLKVSRAMLRELKATRQDIRLQNLRAREQREAAIDAAKAKRKPEGALVRSA